MGWPKTGRFAPQDMSHQMSAYATATAQRIIALNRNPAFADIDQVSLYVSTVQEFTVPTPAMLNRVPHNSWMNRENMKRIQNWIKDYCTRFLTTQTGTTAWTLSNLVADVGMGAFPATPEPMRTADWVRIWQAFDRLVYHKYIPAMGIQSPDAVMDTFTLIEVLTDGALALLETVWDGSSSPTPISSGSASFIGSHISMRPNVPWDLTYIASITRRSAASIFSPAPIYGTPVQGGEYTVIVEQEGPSGSYSGPGILYNGSTKLLGVHPTGSDVAGTFTLSGDLDDFPYSALSVTDEASYTGRAVKAETWYDLTSYLTDQS